MAVGVRNPKTASKLGMIGGDHVLRITPSQPKRRPQADSWAAVGHPAAMSTDLGTPIVFVYRLRGRLPGNRPASARGCFGALVPRAEPTGTNANGDRGGG
ncbi:hypothetical protein FAGKG844_380031 [Frankia sp. AgKG'84/4]